MCWQTRRRDNIEKAVEIPCCFSEANSKPLLLTIQRRSSFAGRTLIALNIIAPPRPSFPLPSPAPHHLQPHRLSFFASLSLVAAKPGELRLTQEEASYSPSRLHIRLHRKAEAVATETETETRLVSKRQAPPSPSLNYLAHCVCQNRNASTQHQFCFNSVLSRLHCIILLSFADLQHVFEGTSNRWVAC